MDDNCLPSDDDCSEADADKGAHDKLDCIDSAETSETDGSLLSSANDDQPGSSAAATSDMQDQTAKNASDLSDGEESADDSEGDA